MSRLALLFVVLLAALPASADATIRVRTGIVYGTGAVAAGRIKLPLDLYRPPASFTGRRPVALLIHGGGFSGGDRKAEGLVRIARGLASRGIAAASIDYRLMPQDPRPSDRVSPLLAHLPDSGFARAEVAAVDDALTAIDYLHAHARALGLDAGRLGVLGSSAGAITANHLAYVLDDYGIPGPKLRFSGSLWGGVLIPAPDGSSGASQLEAGEPALFAVHGTDDSTVPVALDDQLVARARAVGVRNEYHRIRGAEHGYVPSRFFTAQVRGRQTPFDRLLAFADRSLR